MSMKSEIATDKQRIKALYFNNANEEQYVVGSWADKIEAYEEPGLHCGIAYYRVWKNGNIVARVPAWHVEVAYSPGESTPIPEEPPTP